MSNWRHKDEWRRDGSGFCVIVSRHNNNTAEEPCGYDSDHGHRWCIYAYVYPSHKLFRKFNPDGGMWDQPALPMHGYPSYFRTHRDGDGTITAFQIGCDYNHDGDWMYTQMATAEDARGIFCDADELFARLSDPEPDAQEVEL